MSIIYLGDEPGSGLCRVSLCRTCFGLEHKSCSAYIEVNGLSTLPLCYEHLRPSL